LDAGLAGTLLLTVAGALTVLPALYLLLLALAALRPSQATVGPSAHSRVAIVVPAHNEVELLPRCLASLGAQNYPTRLTRIVVVADNCTDGTAAVARASGAEVMVRDEPGLHGKGRALRWAMDRLLAEPDPVDAVVVVDADSVAGPRLVSGLEAVMAAGAEAVQGEYLVLDDGLGAATPLRQAAFLLCHRTRFRGRAALGLPCSLVGNGMLLTRSLLERIPWNAFSGVEDLEYSTNLRLAGVRPRYAPLAMVFAPAPGLGAAAATQRMRWEGGRFQLVRTHLPRLIAALGRRHWSLLDAAIDLAIPPLGLLVLLILAGGGVSLGAGITGAVRLWSVAAWGVGAALLVTYVVIGLRAARAPTSAYRALLSTPRFLVAKLGTYLQMTRGLGADRWQRTERPAEAARRRPATLTMPAVRIRPQGAGDSADRLDVCGVPLDPVDLGQATERILAALGSPTPTQVCTVNLQFLVTARRRQTVRRVLQEADLNVADGAPVVWLSRLLGHRLPGRVTGTDLVPAIAAMAEGTGARIFLLGGTDGVTAEAADELLRRHPHLVISGTLEPPILPLGRMADDDIVARIRDAGADILLVAFGHPKQDLWIAANRDRLPVSVAIGVGGTFDILAGRHRRAPGWTRQVGLEWLYRLIQEPRRLGLRYAACAAWLVGVLAPMAAWRRLAGAPTSIASIRAPIPADREGNEIDDDRRAAVL
jgi:exopolysaccharide biosynthesis WecB/TagA/CpsF family protein